MKFEEIQKIIKEKDSIQSVDKLILKRNLFDNIKIISFIAIFIFELLILYPLLCFFIFQNFINNTDFLIISSLSISLLSFLILSYLFKKHNKTGFVIKFLTNFYSKNITKNNIKLDSIIGKKLNRSLFSFKKNNKIKNYFHSLNKNEQDFFLFSGDFNSYLYESISTYIKTNSIEEIQNNKNSITKILINNLSQNKRKEIVSQIEKKINLEEENEMQYILNSFEKQNRINIVKNKIIKEI